MTRWCMSRTSNAWRLGFAAALLAQMAAAPAVLASREREPMTLKVVAVNPSADKTKTVPVRIDLPQEVTPADVIDSGDLSVEFDTEQSKYYAFKDAVTLNPKQTRVFEIRMRDVWFIPDADLDSLKAQTRLALQRLEKSEYFASAKQLGDSILVRVDGIASQQADETLSRKQQIGGYRRNLMTLAAAREDLTRLEKLLSFTGGPPVPQMLDESPLKSDAPSTTTTWLVIFLIVIFMGLLAGQFFFTWQRRLKTPAETAQDAFPPGGGEPTPAKRTDQP